MKFYYADSLDLVDPEFDFDSERSRNSSRVPQRDDIYAHELMDPVRPYDGILVSKAHFRLGGGSVSGGKYTMAQRKRFEREGARRFLRFPASDVADPMNYPILGDCGAFAYRNEPEPPFSIDELIDFYESGRFTHGVSLDHVVLAYDSAIDDNGNRQGSFPGIKSSSELDLEEARRRKQLSLDNAAEFRRRCISSQVGFEPLGAAHGWSPSSYQDSVRQLLRMGYSYVAIGGLVPLRTSDVEAVLRAVRDVTVGGVRLHLLGIVRPALFELMRESGVASFDSSSPVWQAFKDASDNYYSSVSEGHYMAVRVPQSDQGRVMRMIREGRIEQAEAQRAEADSLAALLSWESRNTGLGTVLDTLRRYDVLVADSQKTRTNWSAIERTLKDRPWESCPCPICQKVGIHVIMFRGANRNRRRGFHNLWWTQRKLESWRMKG